MERKVQMAGKVFQISDAKKVLNARYKSNPNYHLIADENSNFVDDDTFVSLRQAVQIEQSKRDSTFKMYTYDSLLHDWNTDSKMRSVLANALHNGQSLFNDHPMTRLLFCGFVLHGFDADPNTTYFGSGAIDLENKFSNDLGIDMPGYGMDMTNNAFIALLSNVQTHLEVNSKFSHSIRRGQRKLNQMVDDMINSHDPNFFEISPQDATKSNVKSTNFLLSHNENWQGYNLVLTSTNGTNDKATFNFMQLVIQYFQIGDGFSNLTFEDYVQNHFTDSFGYHDFMIRIGLALAGYLGIDYDDLYDVPNVNDAIKQYKQDFGLNSDSEFYLHLFTNHDQPHWNKVRYLTTVNKTDSNISGFQSIYYDQKETLYFDQLSKKVHNDLFKIKFNVDSGNIRNSFSDTDKILDSASYEAEHKSFYFGHTQTLFVTDDFLFTGCCFGKVPTSSKLKSIKNVWCNQIVVFDSQDYNNYKIIDNIFDAVKSLDSSLKGDISYRNEMAITPDQSHVVFCPIDSNGTQWFLLYDYQDLVKALASVKNGDILNLTKVPLKDSFAITQFSVPKDSKNNAFKPVPNSIQGYAITNDLTIFVSSQKLSSREAINVGHAQLAKIFKIFWKQTNIPIAYDLQSRLLETDLDLLKKSKNPLKPLKIISEMEAIQYLPKNNCLLLAVTWHLYNNGLDFDKLFSQLGDISLSDLIAYLRDHNIPDNSDQIDLYCLDL